MARVNVVREMKLRNEEGKTELIHLAQGRGEWVATELQRRWWWCERDKRRSRSHREMKKRTTKK